MKYKRKIAPVMALMVMVVGCAKGSELEPGFMDPTAVSVVSSGGGNGPAENLPVSGDDQLRLASTTDGTGGTAAVEQVVTTVTVTTETGGTAAINPTPTASVPEATAPAPTTEAPVVTVNVNNTINNGQGSSPATTPAPLTGGSAPVVQTTGGTASTPPPPDGGTPLATGGTPPVVSIGGAATGGTGGVSGSGLVGSTGGTGPLATGGTPPVVSIGGTSPTGGTASQATGGIQASGGSATGGVGEAPPPVDGPTVTNIMPIGIKLANNAEVEIFACYISSRPWIQFRLKAVQRNVNLKNLKFFKSTGMNPLGPAEVMILGSDGRNLASSVVASDGIIFVKLANIEPANDGSVAYSLRAITVTGTSPSLLTIMDALSDYSVAGPLATDGTFWGVQNGGTLVTPSILWTIEGNTEPGAPWYTYGAVILGGGRQLN